MPATYEPIASTTLGSNTTDVTFSSIPGTFTDLRLIVVVLASGGSAFDIDVRFNSDTGTNYSLTNLYGSGSAAGSGRVANTNGGVRIGFVPASTAAAWSAGQLDVMSYANTNVYKTALGTMAAPGDYVSRAVGLWRSTSAITSLTCVGGFKSGSTFSLYGIKAA